MFLGHIIIAVLLRHNTVECFVIASIQIIQYKDFDRHSNKIGVVMILA